MTEGLSPTIENSYVVFPNPSPKKIWNKAVGKRFISKIQIYFHEFSTESFFLLIAFCGYLCYLCDLT